MKRWVFDLGAGAVAGTAAVVPMSVLMWMAQQAGLMGKQPPEQITESALSQIDADPPAHRPEWLSVLNHLFFGAGAGAVFGLASRAVPMTAGAQVPAGVLYGLSLWLVSYQGWVPALNLMPPASQDRRGRPASMAAAHVVFGATMARALQWVRGR